ncbi:RebB family R body protein (plasmid) [Candidatus Bealeia paramacronuclearis]|uniref:RebB family R body protein n=1 Tax=Candidatus Bealeia paramacronuclearis TaxID=1921001 RepID=A0ABZ2C6X7_9PROT|nr:RebB family R body protein [Candidatus Bealeia paramacronuclearis]MEB3703404.1 RebB family R body protein [Candidatus Bealeia paramacronuclearis]
MAFPTSVNNQITDAVTQSNVKVLGESAAVALSNLYQSSANSLAQSIQNATFAQQQSNLIHQATTTQGINLIYAVDTAAVGDASEKLARADVPADALMTIMLKALNK